MQKNPYGEALATLDPMKALANTPRRIKALAGTWTRRQYPEDPFSAMVACAMEPAQVRDRSA